jgi:hypothetical protein
VVLVAWWVRLRVEIIITKVRFFGVLCLITSGLPLAWSHAYDEIVINNGGTLGGVVKFAGKAPKLPPLQITKFKEFCKDVPDETLVVGPTQGLRYAVVALAGITKGKAIERESTHELDNLKCRFAPHVQTAGVGQFVLLKNTDPILHTAHARFPRGQPDFNVGLYPGRAVRKPLLVAGVARIICEVHPWMTAYIVVADHPYQAVTDIYGAYLIDDIPPGNYRLKAWHEKLGSQEKQVEVRASASQKIDFFFAPTAPVKK